MRKPSPVESQLKNLVSKNIMLLQDYQFFKSQLSRSTDILVLTRKEDTAPTRKSLSQSFALTFHKSSHDSSLLSRHWSLPYQVTATEIPTTVVVVVWWDLCEVTTQWGPRQVSALLREQWSCLAVAPYRVIKTLALPPSLSCTELSRNISDQHI